MPRYYFNVRTHYGYWRDDVGIELDDENVARDEAVKAAREILLGKVANGEISDGDQFEIVGEDGEIVGTVSLKSVLGHD